MKNEKQVIQKRFRFKKMEKNKVKSIENKFVT
jgi:hypothetical protein